MASISTSAQPDDPASPAPPPTSLVAAVAHTRGRTSVAAYDPAARDLVTMHAADDAAGPDAFAALNDALSTLRPARVHASASADGRLLAALASLAPSIQAEVRLERSALFAGGGDGAARALAAVCGAAASRGSLSAAVALDEPAQCAALGGLASVLLRDGAGDADDEADHRHLVHTLREAPLPRFLAVDDDALAALSIATTEPHPSAAGVGSPKPGACIATLLDRGVMPAGRALTRAWLLRPSRDAATLAARHAAVAWLVDRGDVLGSLRGALKGVRSPTAALTKLRSANGRPRAVDVGALVDGCAALTAAAAVLTDTQEPLPTLLAALPAAVAADGALQRARLAVAAALDVAGAAAGGPLVEAGVLPDLDALHAAYADLPAVLDDVARSEAERVAAAGAAVAAATGIDPTAHLEIAAAYLPQCGFFVRVDGGLLPDAVLAALGDAEFAFNAAAGVVVGGGDDDDRATAADGGTMSRSYALTAHTRAAAGTTAAGTSAPNRRRRRVPSPQPSPVGAFYRTAATVDLDATYGDILNRVRDTEAALVAEVAHRFEADAGAALSRAVAAAAAVDCVAAFAAVARERDWCRPQIVDVPVLEIKGGRHPLTELTVDTYIPSDTVLATPTTPPVALAFGANGSGKSTWAASLAVITLLAHAGSFVPAASARIGLTDRIFFVTGGATSRDRAGPRCSNGALAASLGRAAAALALSTPSSLVILDELGAGTLAADGAGLVGATVRALAARRVRAAATTHYGELASERVLERGDGGIGLYHLAVAQGDGTAPLLLHRLAPGPGDGRSFCLAAAAAGGIPAPVIARADAIAAALAAGQAVAPDQAVEGGACDGGVRNVLEAVAGLARVTEEGGQLTADAAAVLAGAVGV